GPAPTCATPCPCRPSPITLRFGTGEPSLLRLVVHRMPSRLRLHRLQLVGELAGGPGELAHEPHHEPLPTRKRRNVEHPINRIEVNRERQPTRRDLHHRGSSTRPRPVRHPKKRRRPRHAAAFPVGSAAPCRPLPLVVVAPVPGDF